ncbi:protein starmaker [Galendromus occidentalis]|uniref:Protein starmaker n=1 Tax=Galendromus occidentalis TaxID=34638 RepID=A0AAJ6VYS8_9ACAR|nr:protein starmaker [Galendromus occidentalis]
MRRQVYLVAILFASHMIVAHGKYAWKDRSKGLDADQEKNIVNVIKLTPDEDRAKDTKYYDEVIEVVVGGIEKVAMTLLDDKETEEDQSDTREKKKSSEDEKEKPDSGQDKDKDSEKAEEEPHAAEDSDKPETGGKDKDAGKPVEQPDAEDDKGQPATDGEEINPEGPKNREVDVNQPDNETDREMSDIPDQKEDPKDSKKQAEAKRKGGVSEGGQQPLDVPGEGGQPKSGNVEKFRASLRRLLKRAAAAKDADKTKDAGDKTDDDTAKKEADAGDSSGKKKADAEGASDKGLLTTTFVFDKIETLEKFDFSAPIEFFVSKGAQILDGSALADKADDIKQAIYDEMKAKPALKLTVEVVNQGLAAWAIVLIVLAVLLVVGAAGYLIMTYMRK